MFQEVASSGGTPNFTLLPPPAAYDPVQLAVLDHRGVFKGKKVGLFAGEETDGAELKVVQSSLKSLGVHVAESAVDGAPQSDEVATNQQAALIAQRFQQAGVNEVIAVGTGATVWPESLQANESTYLPAWIATDESGLESAVLGSSIQPKYLENVLTTSPVPSNYTLWHTPAVQACDRVVRKAYPSLKITPPTNPLTGSDQTFYAVESACLNIDLFATIAKAAGKNLTWSTFTHAGYALRNAAIPGSGAPVSFAPGRPYALGPVYLVTFDKAKNVLQFADSAGSEVGAGGVRRATAGRLVPPRREGARRRGRERPLPPRLPAWPLRNERGTPRGCRRACGLSRPESSRGTPRAGRRCRATAVWRCCAPTAPPPAAT